MKTLENMIYAAMDAAKNCPNMSQQGIVDNIINRIHVALIAATYAGHIEAAAETNNFNGIGADSYQHREEYMNYAANFEFPFGYDGKIESDTVFNVVSEYMWDTYGSNEEEE